MSSKPSAIMTHQWMHSPGLIWTLVAAAALCHFWICTQLTSVIALDLDTANFIYSLDFFDIRRLAPQPPGYLPYVLLLRAIRALTGLDSMSTLTLASRFFSTATVLAVPIIVKRLLPKRPGFILFSALLCAFHPFLIFHGVDGQTHASEGFFAALFFYNLVRPIEGSEKSVAIWAGVLLSFGMAMRPSLLCW